MGNLMDAREGDRVVFKRQDGLYDVENVVVSGQLQTVDRPPIKTLKEAYDIALGHSVSGARIWTRSYDVPNVIQPYRM